MIYELVLIPTHHFSPQKIARNMEKIKYLVFIDDDYATNFYHKIIVRAVSYTHLTLPTTPYV